MKKTDKHAATSGLKRIANMFKKKKPQQHDHKAHQTS